MTTSLMAQGTSRIGVETKTYFRAADTLFFTFLFPFVMLAIFSAAFSASGEVGPPGAEISIAALYLPAMLAAGIFLSGVQNLAIDIALEKSNGTLKRLGGTPLSPVGYFAGKIGQVFVTGTLQAGLLILAGWLVLGIELPTDPAKWVTFAWVFVLGLTTCALLGIALSALPRSGKSAAAVVIPVGLILQFISGVYLQWNMLPDWLQNFASLFPLKWIAQGMRSVFLPEGWESLEQNGSWNLPGVAIALGIWLVVGFVLSRVTFRWIRRDA
jgi:ABC-2 type transport system permease protein